VPRLGSSLITPMGLSVPPKNDDGGSRCRSGVGSITSRSLKTTAAQQYDARHAAMRRMFMGA
jgi:hypothetical protein